MKVRGEWTKANPGALAQAAAWCCEQIADALPNRDMEFTGRGWRMKNRGAVVEVTPDEEPVDGDYAEKAQLTRDLYLVCYNCTRGFGKMNRDSNFDWRELCEDFVSSLAGHVWFEDRHRTGEFNPRSGCLLKIEKGKYGAHACDCGAVVEFPEDEIFC